MLFNVLCAVIVECLYPWYVGMFAVMLCKERRHFSRVFFFSNTERRDMGLYEVPWSIVIWDGDYVSQLP